ncbi:hypothetical protein PINS_up007975 [Pythium insidiosum]|nr:hypothetical protein PINS_up007975 [Pythium insidiosum]
MGAKSSKTRPSGGGVEETTFIVTIVPDKSVGDDVQPPAAIEDDDDVAARPVTAPSKVSKVQEMREARAETARQGSFGVRSVTASASSVALKLSSSEDSDAEDDDAHPGRVRRRKKKRKKKRRSKTATKEPPQEPVKPETSPTTRTSLRVKLNELRTPKKAPPPPLAAGAGAGSQDESKPAGGHFEQIKDAYSMEQPDSKEAELLERRDSDATSTGSPRISRVSVVQLPLPSSQQQHPSPRQSSSSFFMSMVDSFQKPSFRSRRSNSSVVADSRYPSRRSPTPRTSIMSPLSRVRCFSFCWLVPFPQRAHVVVV